MNIAIVEDDEQLLKLFTMLIEARGHTVQAIPSGQLAISQLRNSPPDVALLDLEMPEVTGFDVIKALRQGEQLRYPIIAFSAHAWTDEIAEVKRAGFDGFISKPVTGVQLLEQVQRIVEGFESEKFSATS